MSSPTPRLDALLSRQTSKAAYERPVMGPDTSGVTPPKYDPNRMGTFGPVPRWMQMQRGPVANFLLFRPEWMNPQRPPVALSQIHGGAGKRYLDALPRNYGPGGQFAISEPSQSRTSSPAPQAPPGERVAQRPAPRVTLGGSSFNETPRVTLGGSGFNTAPSVPVAQESPTTSPQQEFDFEDAFKKYHATRFDPNSSRDRKLMQQLKDLYQESGGNLTPSLVYGRQYGKSASVLTERRFPRLFQMMKSAYDDNPAYLSPGVAGVLGALSPLAAGVYAGAKTDSGVRGFSHGAGNAAGSIGGALLGGLLGTTLARRYGGALAPNSRLSPDDMVALSEMLGAAGGGMLGGGLTSAMLADLSNKRRGARPDDEREKSAFAYRALGAGAKALGKFMDTPGGAQIAATGVLGGLGAGVGAVATHGAGLVTGIPRYFSDKTPATPSQNIGAKPVGSTAPSFINSIKPSSLMHTGKYIGDFTPRQFMGGYGDQLDTEIAKAKSYQSQMSQNDDPTPALDYDRIDRPFPVRQIKGFGVMGPRFTSGKNPVVIVPGAGKGMDDDSLAKNMFSTKEEASVPAVAAHEMRHAWQVGDTTKGLIDSVIPPAYKKVKKALPMSAVHGLSRVEQLGWLGGLQQELYKSRGSRMETPEDARSVLEELTSDEGAFLKKTPIENTEVLRGVRWLKQVKDLMNSEDPKVREQAEGAYQEILQWLSNKAPSLVYGGEPGNLSRMAV